MSRYMSKILAFLLLIGVAQSLTACVVYDNGGHYHHWHDDYHRH